MNPFPNNFTKYYNNEKFSDMRIRTTNGDIWVHSIIMSSSSSVFETYLSSSLNKNNIFELIDHDTDAVEYVLKWIYSSGEDVNIETKEQYINVLAVSNFLGLRLTSIISGGSYREYVLYFRNKLGFTTVELIQLAHLYNNNMLIQCAASLYYSMRFDLDDVIDFSELSLSEYTMFYAICKCRNYDRKCDGALSLLKPRKLHMRK